MSSPPERIPSSMKFLAGTYGRHLKIHKAKQVQISVKNTKNF